MSDAPLASTKERPEDEAFLQRAVPEDLERDLLSETPVEAGWIATFFRNHTFQVAWDATFSRNLAFRVAWDATFFRNLAFQVAWHATFSRNLGFQVARSPPHARRGRASPLCLVGQGRGQVALPVRVSVAVTDDWPFVDSSSSRVPSRRRRSETGTVFPFAATRS